MNRNKNENKGALTLGTLGALLAVLVTATFARADDPALAADRMSVGEGLSQGTVLAIHEDRQGYLWFGTEDGLNRFDGRSLDVYRFNASDPSSLPAGFVRAIAEDAKGRLWIGTEGGGLAYLDPATDVFVRHRLKLGGLASRVFGTTHVQSLEVGSDGYVWIGTGKAGLLRLHPDTGEVSHFRHDPASASSLAGNRVNAILEGRDGHLWIGTNAGLDRFDPALEDFVHHGGHPVRALLEDRSGVLWVGTDGDGLSAFDPATALFRRYRHDPAAPSSLGNDHVRSLLEDSEGRLWVGTLAGLGMLDPERKRFAHSGQDSRIPSGLADLPVLSLHQDLAGRLWAASPVGGLTRWDSRAFSFARHSIPAGQRGSDEEPRDIVTSFAEDDRGRIFIGTFGSGLARVNRSTGEVVRIRHDASDPGSLSDDRVMALLRDHRGRLWIGTKSNGLDRFDPNNGTFTSFRHDPDDPSSLSANGVMSLFEDERGRLWVGTFGGGLNRFIEKSQSFQSFRHDPENPASLSSDRITCVIDAEKGRLWVGTDGGGLNLFDPASGRVFRLPHDSEDPSSLPVGTIFSMYRDQGTLWVGTAGGGLVKMADSTRGAALAVYTERNGLPNAVVYGIQPDVAGDLWLSTNNGLARFDPVRETFTNFDVSHGLQANEFNFGASYRTAGGEIFFGGVNGYNTF